MRVKTSELTRFALDWAVERCMGLPDYGQRDMEDGYHPSTDWAQGGPIIEREEIRLTPPLAGETDWLAACGNPDVAGPTPLIAAMRCYVASKLGDEVNVPEELCVRCCCCGCTEPPVKPIDHPDVWPSCPQCGMV